MLDRTNLGDIAPRDAPDHPLLVDLREPDRPRRWSAAELEQAANAVARGLLGRGFRRGDRVAIVSANRAEFLAAYFGTMRAGLTAVPLNYKLPKETVEYVLDDAEIGAAFVDRERRALLPEGIATFDFDDGSYDALLDPGPFEAVDPAPEDIAKILYTSGSTGRPKGVPLPHAGQLWALGKYFVGADQGRRDRTLVVAPTYHKNGLFFSMMAISNQMTIVSMPRFETRAYLRAVAEHRCTVLTGIPTMFALIARETELLASLDLAAVRLVTIGSAPLTDALYEQVGSIFPNAVVQNGYGTTEAGPCAFGPHPDGFERPPLSLGYPLVDIEWRLVDGPSPEHGAFELRTPALMPGYLNQPDKTAERIHDGWYATGDVMRHDERGFFYFVGRVDDMFVCGGENVYPGEVEKLLERCPGVAQAAVVPVPDEIKGEIPVAFVVASGDQAIDPERVKRFALEHGPAYAHPRLVLEVDEVPVATTHKVDRRLLIDRATEAIRRTGRR
ncbi:MAG: class I adenylate-forming enzyme family protein [Gemmatimonadales bacterium]